ncbi:MAG: hypothetical protein QG635_1923 [Bacteroidota bacterium]|nr:hypothetical protein [Bacteroidota bacterium]
MEKLRTDITFALPHEFRTALNGILGFSTQIYKITLEKTALKSKYVEEIHDMASLITASGRHLQRLTENFLLYSQLSTYQDKQDKIEDLQKLQLNNSKEIITELVLQVSKEFKREWDFDMKIGNYCLQISSYHFHKIIFELIDNALKFSSPGNIITIEDENNYGCYSLKVIDNGRGMTPEQIENIGAYCQFDRYVYEQQGTGMGIIIAKLLVFLHSGKFNISSKINTGTEVSISLPLAQCKG